MPVLLGAFCCFLPGPPDENASAGSRPAYERAALLWHGHLRRAKARGATV